MTQPSPHSWSTYSESQYQGKHRKFGSLGPQLPTQAWDIVLSCNRNSSLLFRTMGITVHTPMDNPSTESVFGVSSDKVKVAEERKSCDLKNAIYSQARVLPPASLDLLPSSFILIYPSRQLRLFKNPPTSRIVSRGRYPRAWRGCADFCLDRTAQTTIRKRPPRDPKRLTV